MEAILLFWNVMQLDYMAVLLAIGNGYGKYFF